MTKDQAYAKYSKAMAKLHKDAIPNEPLPPFYHTPEYPEPEPLDYDDAKEEE